MNIYNIDHWIKKGLTIEEAKSKVQELKERTNRFNVNFWIKRGLTEEEAKNKISEIQKIYSSKADRKKIPNPTRIDYWLNKGFDYETAKKKLSERQRTFTLEKCIKKYGELEGAKIYNERQIKWQKTLIENNNLSILNKKRGLNKQEFIKKYGEEKYNDNILKKKVGSSKDGYIKKHGVVKYQTKINNIKKSIINRKFKKISKISFQLFKDIENEINEKCYYGINEQILQFYIDEKYFCFYVDFKINNKIIEFYGDYWHGNPFFYKPEDVVGSKYKYTKVEDIWKKDKIRLELIKERGYDVLVIWENDYKKNKEEIKNKCIKWIKNL